MTRGPLADKIARRIASGGPLPVAAFMAMALYDPEAGYYAAREPLGAGGDFVTAPEISQVFGELVGVWCAEMWETIGSPDPVILAELGPGSGALAVDLQRAAAGAPGFRRAQHLHLVEVSLVLRMAQQHRLGVGGAVWHERPDDLPDGPLLLVANEFLDALPIRQLVRGTRHWAERMVGLDRGGQFEFVAGPGHPALSLLVPPGLRETAPPETVFEICPPALALAARLGARLKREPGAALLVDYGRVAGGCGSSLRGVAHHRPADPLCSPGNVDLSADVDFAAFAEAARTAGAAVWGPVPQGCFLARLGAAARLAALSARATPAQRRSLESGLERLIDPRQMGSVFKAVALTSPGLPAPPGFA